ncbi:MAG TPA: CHAT domain-containing protein [Streptosporangiaceae bacterium]|nr:CHAT domain-containing protein [Streptosporangiaceae bacterium]
MPTAGPPAYLRLPKLTRSEVADQVASFLRGPSLDTIAELMALIAATARWLWHAGLSELAAELPAGALVTIVPAGLLSLLPVHAASGPTAPDQNPEDWEFLADRVTVRYAPNARMLVRAQTRAASMPDERLSLLSVAAPDAIPGSRLPYAAREAEQVWQQWHQPADQEPVTGGTISDVEPLLAERTVWHFACHCQARPDRILDSALVLDGGELTLRAIFALPAAPHRLAILSACETHRSGTDLPDEGTGLPTGLIQAGFAGVVAAHWPVNDRSTSDLMTRFHDLWRNEGLSPAAALAQAQQQCRAQRRYRHPFWWAPFSLTGQ